MVIKHYDVLTLFPEGLEPYFQSSLLEKAIKKKLLSIRVHDLRKFTRDKHRRVDDEPYGGGQGMVLKVEPIASAIESLRDQKTCIIYLTPQGKLLTQSLVEEISVKHDRFLLLCGRYEGVDERAIERWTHEEISIGDYVLMGGELPAAVFIEATARLIPGVVGKAESVIQDSHSSQLLEYPHYTRPEEYKGLRVPQVLLSGNHEAIRRYRMQEALRRTLERRPDLLEKIELTEEQKSILKKLHQESKKES